MKISISKKFSFEAAHNLPLHDGKCKNLHGHSYVLEVFVSGLVQNEGPKIGMVMDFSDLSKIVKEKIIDIWDHKYLNDIVAFPTTAENLAQEIFKILENENLSVNKVILHETETSSAIVEK